MNWLTDFVRPKIKKVTPKEIADNLWVKCPICGQMLFSKEMKKSLYVCTSCGHHLRLYVDKRLKMLFDGEFNEIALPKVKEDPLKFKDTKRYTDRLKAYRKSTESNDAIRVAQGDIGGIPRVLDAGQCNDSYSLALIALKLQEVFGLDDINDLPIVYNIAWYEQKAVILLLALLSLGFKNIHIGPTLPAFVSPAILNVLAEQFNLGGITDVKQDLQRLHIA